MNQNSILFGMVNGPVGLGVDKVSQWLDHEDFAEGGEGGLASLSQTIPAGSFLLGYEIKVEEILATASDSLINLGTAAEGMEIANAADISGGIGTIGGPAVTALQYLTSATTVHVEIEETTWANLTAGKFLVTVYYLTTNLELAKGYANKLHS